MSLNTSMDHVSSIFTLDPKLPLGHNLQATFHHIFRLDPLHTFKLNHTTKLIQTTQNCRIQIAATQQNRSAISYPMLQQTLVCIRAFLSLISRIYVPSIIPTHVYFHTYYRANFTAHTRFIFSKPTYIRASSVAN